MRALAAFLGLIAAAMAGGAVLLYPLYRVVERFHVFPPHRVFDRLVELLFLIGLAFFVRRMRLNSRAALGFGVPMRVFAVQFAGGFGIGVLLMVLVVAAICALGLRSFLPLASVPWSSLLLSALSSGIAVGLLEEILFRSILYTPLERESGTRFAVLATAIVYASVHFLGQHAHIAPEDVGWASGWLLLARFFTRLAHPAAIADALLALFLLGILLALVRQAAGNIAPDAGLHAGFVTIIAVTRHASVLHADTPLSWLIGSFDGIVGYLVALALAVTLSVFMLCRARLFPRAPPLDTGATPFRQV